MVITTPINMVLRINLNIDIPADFMAANSKRSPRLPYTIIDDNKVASGKANGIMFADA